MDSVSAEVFMELDPSKKDIEWARKAVTNIRMWWRPYVDIELLRENKQFLFSKQSLEKIKAQYKDEEFLKSTEWRNPGLLEAIRNTLMEELTKDPPKAELRSTDPSAVALRKKDLGLWKNKAMIESPISAIQKGIGDPSQYKVSGIYKSNIEELEAMDLDPTNPDDMNFAKDYHVLDADIAGQALLNNVMSLNRFDEEILRKLVIDILAIRKICIQAYVDKITGQIKYKYIYPDTAWGIFGDSFDGHDDQARGWQDNVFVGEFLQMAGNDFDFERDWRKLLGSINFTGRLKYTGFNRRGAVYNCFNNPDHLSEIGLEGSAADNILSWDESFRFKVSVGYVEFNTWEATSTNLYRTMDSAFVDSVSFGYDLEGRKQQTEYYKESKYQQQWYGSFFLATGPTTQMVYNFSKVYYQQLYGANDEYSAGSMVYYREPGDPAVSMVKTDIELITAAFYKMLFLIYKAKPEDEEYVWEELIEQAKIFKAAFPNSKTPGADNTVDGIIGQILAYQRANTIKIRSFPKIDGKTIGQIPQLGGHKGIDPLTGIMQAVVEWGEARLAKKILGNGMRLGMNPPSRESNKSEQNTVDASQNSTQYIYRMIQYSKERIATITTLYAQDIIKFKDSLPYNFLVNLMGNERFDDLTDLDEFALHRYGKFFKDYNSDVAKEELRQAALAALTQKQITYVQYVLVTQTEDFREGAKKLALWQYQTDKKLRAQQVQDIQMQGQIAQQQHANDMELAQYQRGTLWGEKDKANYGLITANQIQAKSKEDVKQMTIQSEPAKQDAKSQAAQDLEYTKANLAASQPMGA